VAIEYPQLSRLPTCIERLASCLWLPEWVVRDMRETLDALGGGSGGAGAGHKPARQRAQRELEQGARAATAQLRRKVHGIL
jgi:hypothetical protein